MCVVGDGKVGYYLVKTLLARGNNVAVVEKERERCERLAQELDVLVIQGDGTAPQALADAQADRAEVIAAVTGRDEDNLVACQVAKRLFGVGRAIARVNNPKNEAVLEALGVDAAVSSTSLIAQLIEEEMAIGSLRPILTLGRGQVVLVELRLNADSPAAGRQVQELALPEDVVLVAIARGRDVLLPRGGTRLEPGDSVVALLSTAQRGPVKRLLVG